jgi:hypothetical protein
MNKILLITASLALASVTGCAYRDAKMFSDDVNKAVAPKQPDMKACYDGVLKSNPTAAGKVSVAFEIETEEGKFTNITVDKSKTTAPEPVQECVTKNLQGLAISPPDKKLGQGSMEFDFAPGAPPKS